MRLFPRVRPKGDYRRSIELLAQAKEWAPEMITKSGVIAGMGESKDEIVETMADLREADVDVLTIGQYLRPTEKHIKIARFYRPEEFDELKTAGLAMGFSHVESGPLVRSSYHAHEHTAAPEQRAKGATCQRRMTLVVIGGGPGGYVAAIRAAQLGLKTAVVERDQVGGVCLNWGCIPSKALLRNAEVVNLVRNAADYGVSVENASYDMGAAIDRSRRVVDQMTKGVHFLLKKNKVDLVQGCARLDGPGTVAVEAWGRAA